MELDEVLSTGITDRAAENIKQDQDQFLCKCRKVLLYTTTKINAWSYTAR